MDPSLSECVFVLVLLCGFNKGPIRMNTRFQRFPDVALLPLIRWRYQLCAMVQDADSRGALEQIFSVCSMALGDGRSSGLWQKQSTMVSTSPPLSSPSPSQLGEKTQHQPVPLEGYSPLPRTSGSTSTLRFRNASQPLYSAQTESAEQAVGEISDPWDD